VLRVLQLSDPHLLADPRGRCPGVVALEALEQAWCQALAQLGEPPDLLLISGDPAKTKAWAATCGCASCWSGGLCPLLC